MNQEKTTVKLIFVDEIPVESKEACRKAWLIEPQNQEFFIALAQSYLKTGQTDKARTLALEMLSRFPEHSAAKDLLRYLGK